MKITLFTSNNIRHNYLINLLSEFSEELNVIQECGTIFPGLVPDTTQSRIYLKIILKKYFRPKTNFSLVII